MEEPPQDVSTEQLSQAGSGEQLPQAVGVRAAQELRTEQISQAADAEQLSSNPPFQQDVKRLYPNFTTDVDSLVGEEVLGDTNCFKEYVGRADATNFRRSLSTCPA